jgi:type IX secretion system PorP/SprF family membrane protein
MKNIVFTGILLSIMLNQQIAYGQQEPQFVQFKDNLLTYNPGYAGSRGMMNFTALYRKQWAGFRGAPESTSFFIHTPLKYESVGLGLSLVSDKAGPLSQSWINVDFSYALRFKKERRLAFGVKGGVNILNAGLTNLVATDLNDPDLSQNYTNLIKPNFGAGIHYSSKKFYIGASIPRILQLQNTGIINYRDNRHYYAMAGGYLTINRMLKYSPAVLLKITENAPFGFDITNSLIVYDKFWFGVNYKLEANVGVYIQYLFSNQLKVGYAYELETTALKSHSGGSHEVILSYDLNFLKKNITNPRYF